MAITGSNNPTECTPVLLTQFIAEFASLSALTTTHPTASAGSYAIVNTVGGDIVYFYSVINSGWFTLSSALVSLLLDDAIVNGVLNKAPTQNAVFDALAAKEDISNKDTNTSLGSSDSKYPSQKAVKTYVDTELSTAIVGFLDDRGNYDASSNLFPSTGGSGSSGAILKGNLWTVSIAGTLGGIAVTAGDIVRCLVNTPGQTSSNWAISENNLGYAAENSANKTNTVVGNETSTSLYLSVKGYYDYLVGLTWLNALGFGGFLSGLDEKSEPVDDDAFPYSNSEDSNSTVIITYFNLKKALKDFFDGIYSSFSPRLQTVTSSATVTPTSTDDLVTITAQAAALTLANPTGTFAEGQALMIRIKDNGTARAITFGSNYRAIGITLPTTTVVSKTMYLGIIYNSTDSKWDIVGINQQA